jgi:hypothetical protein
MLVAFLPAALGIFLDSRLITGVPAWLKPAKFAISSAIYAGTLAWLFRYIPVWPRFVRAMGNIVAGVLLLEVAIIYLQAAHGTTSHFNAGTPLDAILFAIMGVSIAILWLASAGILVALFRTKFPNAAWGWALRLGLLISLLGSGAGGLMVRPNAYSPAGAHTVGAPDGGPGLPGVGWSTQHGDLRVPHFFGLHAVQILPLLAWLLTRQRHRGQTEIVFATAAGYFAVTAVLLWQALRGQPLIHWTR